MATDSDEREHKPEGAWHDQQPVIIAAGIAAVLLIALLIYAVLHAADRPDRPPSSVDIPSVTTSASRTTTSTSYTVPSVQTSQDSPGVVSPGSTPPPADEPGGVLTTDTPATTTNPYPTTTPTNAGHV